MASEHDEPEEYKGVATKFIREILSRGPETTIYDAMVEQIAKVFLGKGAAYPLSIQASVIYQLIKMYEAASKSGIMVATPLMQMIRPDISPEEAMHIAHHLVVDKYVELMDRVPPDAEKH